jgi:hypothetical protein
MLLHLACVLSGLGVALAGALGVDCLAFLEEPAARPETGRGRPSAAAAEQAEAPKPKRPREPAVVALAGPVLGLSLAELSAGYCGSLIGGL